MKITSVLASVALASALLVGQSFAAGGSVPESCLDGTAPEGWLRDGGFCELTADGPEVTSKAPEEEPDVLVHPNR